MDLATITMDRTAARKAFLEYRAAVRDRHDAEEEQIMRGYRALAQGRQLLNLREAIAAGGVDEHDRPRLAVMHADQRWCYLARDVDGSVRFACEPYPHARRKHGVVRLPEGTLPRLTGEQPWCRAVYGASRLRAIVPIVPPGLRPAHHLRNYHVLWEVDRWEKAPRPARRPRAAQAHRRRPVRRRRDLGPHPPRASRPRRPSPLMQPCTRPPAGAGSAHAARVTKGRAPRDPIARAQHVP
jgi:hypothetical protein